MSKQDKATTEKFAKTLRELVKRPENKVCADCKRNDPRWASWNIGVFLCIRCSGIHRGMGTHISKVKSVDLDVWTPEQMESIQKWGNRLANLYWEAHLKAGHVPPEHKLESFIRSKYESRRWALDGPPPTDPSTLDNESAAPSSRQQPPSQSTSLPPTTTSKSPPPPSNSVSSKASITTRQPQARQLLSANYPPKDQRQTTTQATSSPSVIQEPTQKPVEPENDIFSLDFHAPPVASSENSITNLRAQQVKKDTKQDILSLYASSAVPTPSTFGQFGGAQTSAWGSQPQTHPTSMLGNGGSGLWGTSSGWSGAPAAPVVPSAQGNLWNNSSVGAPGLPQQQTHLFNTNDVWGSSGFIAPPIQGSVSVPGGGGLAASQTKDDVFGDIWGGFK